MEVGIRHEMCGAAIRTQSRDSLLIVEVRHELDMPKDRSFSPHVLNPMRMDARYVSQSFGHSDVSTRLSSSSR